MSQRGSVFFPEFIGERLHMLKFYKKEGLPSHVKRWQRTVDAMLDGIDTDLPVYLMVDQSVVDQTGYHRRPGVHVDGYWNDRIRAHGPGHHGVSCHGGISSHGGTPTPRHGGVPRHCGGSSGWDVIDFSSPEALILATDVRACRVYEGEYQGIIGEGGDCSKVDLSKTRALWLNENQVYAGNVGMLHETTRVVPGTQRTVVRLNVPGWTPH